jgi:putative MATE family efflux protein
MMSIAILFRRPIISLLYGAISEDVMQNAATYFLITAASYPCLAVYNANAAIFRSMGNSRVPMMIALLVNIMNIGGNLIFIFGLRFGVAGAAISTLLSRTAAAVITYIMLVSPTRGSRASRMVTLAGISRARISFPMIRNILNVGIPGALENSMFQFGRLATQRIFTSFGTAAIAGNAVASVINAFSFMPGQAFGFALVTVVGQCIGAGDYNAAKADAAKILKAAWALIFVMNVLIYIFLEPIVSCFSLGSEAHNYAVQFLRVHCISMSIGWVTSFALPSALRAAGDARYVMYVAAISMWVVRVSLAYILVFPLGFGPLGVWLAMGADFACRSILYLTRWRGGKWQTKRVIG